MESITKGVGVLYGASDLLFADFCTECNGRIKQGCYKRGAS